MDIGELHVDIVIWLQDVLRVSLAPHALSDIEVGGGELERAPAGNGCDSCREGRRIADGLVIHILILWVCAVHVALPCDGVEQGEVPRASCVVTFERCVQSTAEGIAVVHHRPCIGPFQRQADDAVLNLVYIGIRLNIYRPF